MRFGKGRLAALLGDGRPALCCGVKGEHDIHEVPSAPKVARLSFPSRVSEVSA